jgi:hypothetical protein
MGSSSLGIPVAAGRHPEWRGWLWGQANTNTCFRRVTDRAQPNPQSGANAHGLADRPGSQAEGYNSASIGHTGPIAHIEPYPHAHPYPFFLTDLHAIINAIGDAPA